MEIHPERKLYTPAVDISNSRAKSLGVELKWGYPGNKAAQP